MKRKDFLHSKIDEYSVRAKKAYELYRSSSDFLHFDSLSMACFQVANYVIDLCEEVVMEKSLGIPSTYRDTVVLLLRGKVINPRDHDMILAMVTLRNKIAHEYHVIAQVSFCLSFFISRNPLSCYNDHGCAMDLEQYSCSAHPGLLALGSLGQGVFHPH